MSFELKKRVLESRDALKINIIFDIINELRVKSGVPKIYPSEMPIKIKFKQKNGAVAFVNPLETNSIYINPSEEENHHGHEIVDTIIHELVHLLGYKNRKGSGQIGISINHRGNAMNEAITELVTKYVLGEYCRRTGLGKIETRISYPKNVKLLRSLIYLMSKYAGVTDGVIMKGFLHAYFSGEDILSKSFIRTLPREIRYIYKLIAWQNKGTYSEKEQENIELLISGLQPEQKSRFLEMLRVFTELFFYKEKGGLQS